MSGFAATVSTQFMPRPRGKQTRPMGRARSPMRRRGDQQTAQATRAAAW